jgi:hypothetical protein
MAKLNPYRYPIESVLNGVEGHMKINSFLDKKIKDKELCQLIKDIIELRSYNAFNEGREQGKYETGQALKEIINFENPEFENANNDEN